VSLDSTPFAHRILCAMPGSTMADTPVDTVPLEESQIEEGDAQEAKMMERLLKDVPEPYGIRDTAR
jgi:hypothetical protein